MQAARFLHALCSFSYFPFFFLLGRGGGGDSIIHKISHDKFMILQTQYKVEKTWTVNPNFISHTSFLVVKTRSNKKRPSITCHIFYSGFHSKDINNFLKQRCMTWYIKVQIQAPRTVSLLIAWTSFTSTCPGMDTITFNKVDKESSKIVNKRDTIPSQMCLNAKAAVAAESSEVHMPFMRISNTKGNLEKPLGAASSHLEYAPMIKQTDIFYIHTSLLIVEDKFR